MQETLGSIISGSLSRGLTAQISTNVANDIVRAGSFVVIEDNGDSYFSLISDLELSASDPALLNLPVSQGSFTDRALRGSALFTKAVLKPSLVLRNGEENPEPVRTIPRHFAEVSLAEDDDFIRIFGDTKDKKYFAIGKPLGAEVDIPINLERFVERSNGIFGRSGTGKSFLTRLLLAGTIQSGSAVNLVFDMHNEYGWQGADENRTKGLRQLFPGKVQVFTLDEASSKRRGSKIDGVLTVEWDDLTVSDLDLLSPELNLAEGALDNVELLRRKFGPSWLKIFVETEPQRVPDLADEINANQGSISSFHRKLQKLSRLPFLGPISSSKNLVDALLGGHSVVLEFGQQNSLLAYALVSSILTRKLHGVYVEKCENAATAEERPTPLMITIEEAHKFLNPKAAKLTTFGTIARELRKYNVTLLIVDQRPSSIDREVLSQIGSRIIASITDEADLDSVLTGMADPQRMRGIIASLDSQQQVLLIGHALPMPVVVRSRDYNADFYRSVSKTPLNSKLPPKTKGDGKSSVSPEDQSAINALFGE